MVSRGIVAIALCVSACGRLDFDVTADGGDGSSTGDGMTATADASPCLGTSHLITDNFDDGVLDASLWGRSYQDVTSRHAEVNGQLEFQLSAGVTFDYAGYVSTSLYDYGDDRVFVEVVKANSELEGNALLLLNTTDAHTDGPSVEFEAGNLLVRIRIADVIYDRATMPYDPIAHRWWQIRERAGRTYWETSPDGIAWTTQHDEPSAADTQTLVTLAAGYDSLAATQDDVVRFDNLNGGGAPPLCP